MEFLYVNGSYIGAEQKGVNNVEQLTVGSIIKANSLGLPFRGKPEDMAIDTLKHLSGMLPHKPNLFPVVFESTQGVDKEGYYANEVIF